jgi:hypothetical protein
LLGDLDRLHRHFREVDRNDDVSNFQPFHAHSMNASQLPDSALLGKIEAFFALRLAAMHSVLDCRPKNEGSDSFTLMLAGGNPRPEFGG